MTDQSDDPRVARTRTALIQAFGQLVLGRNYEEIRIADIVDLAGVGRSTFYEHFKGKDDLLLQSLSGLFSVLAKATGSGHDMNRLRFVLEHFWENRRLTRGILLGTPGDYVRKLLARQVKEELEGNDLWQGRSSALSTSLAAEQIAGSQVNLIIAWLIGDSPASAEVVATAIENGSKGLIQALTR